MQLGTHPIIRVFNDSLSDCPCNQCVASEIQEQGTAIAVVRKPGTPGWCGINFTNVHIYLLLCGGWTCVCVCTFDL